MKSEIKLPYSKMWLVDGPQIDVKPGEVNIKYDYLFENEEKKLITIQFDGVITYKYTDESCFNGPLEAIAEGIMQFDMEDSPWLQECKAARDRFFKLGSAMHDMYGQFDFTHYAVWFDHVGTFEIIARTVQVLESVASESHS